MFHEHGVVVVVDVAAYTPQIPGTSAIYHYCPINVPGASAAYLELGRS